MRSLYFSQLLFISFYFLFPAYSFGQERDLPGITSKSGTINLVTANVCVYLSVLTLNAGVDTSGNVPTLGYGCNPQMGPFNYTHFDSLPPLNEKLIGLEMAPFGSPTANNKFFYVGRDSSVIANKLFYSWQVPCQPTISSHDTIYVDSIKAISAIEDKLVLIRDVASPQINLQVYNDSLSTLLFGLSLNIRPLLISGESNTCAVIGVDSLNRTVLKVIDLNTQLIIKDTLLGPLHSNPYKLSVTGWNIHLAAEPGDSCITILRYNYISGLSSAAIIYSQSGIHAGDWEGGYFHFQPEADSSSFNLHRGIIVYDANTMTSGSNYSLNKRFRLICHPDNGWGNFAYIYCTEEDSSTAMLQSFVYYSFNYVLLDSMYIRSKPFLFCL